ncbi:hypothetical protein E5D57_007855 [Metarhizium anisopliae]|nr:hypothetical protein E5D57_007855 [Metarhizium anisopliae]
MVWLASPEADLLKGKYIWANWDVIELKERAKEIAESYLFTMKLGGWLLTARLRNPAFQADKGARS